MSVLRRLFPTARRPVLGLVGLLAWSCLMLFVGSVAGPGSSSGAPLASGVSSLLVAQAQADTADAAGLQLVRLDRDRLEGNNLGEFAPYEPEFGDLVARGHDYYYSEDGNFGLGVWESKPGTITYTDLEYHELMVVLHGSLVMTDVHGISQTYTEGEGVVLPQGWSGELTVPEGGVRKIWVSYMGGKKGQGQ